MITVANIIKMGIAFIIATVVSLCIDTLCFYEFEDSMRSVFTSGVMIIIITIIYEKIRGYY